MSKLSNLPAFPVPLNDGESFVSKADCDGMSIRQYAAIKAMQGLLAGRNSDRGMMDYSETAVEIADALLAELGK